MSNEGATTVLIVDDDPAVAMIFAEVLTLAGCKVRKAGSGAEALEAFAEEPAEVVLFDFKLGDMSGLQCSERMQALGTDFASILVTGDLSRATAIDAANQGFQQVIEKPLPDTDRLVEAVARSAAGVRLRVENAGLQQELERRNQELSRANERLEQAQSHAESIFNAVPFPLLLLGAERSVVARNAAYDRFFDDARLPEAFLSDTALERLRSDLGEDACCYLYNRTWQAEGRPVVFDIVARALSSEPDAPLLLCLEDRTASQALKARFDRNRRLSALGAITSGLVDDMMDPVTLMRVNVEQLADLQPVVRRGWDEMRGIVRARAPVQQEAFDNADRALRESRDIAEECETALGRLNRVLRALRDFLDHLDEEELGPVDLQAAVDGALQLARGQLRPRCETRVSLGPLGQVWARQSDLQQVFVDLLLGAAGSLRSWGVLHLEGRAQGEATLLSIRIEEDAKASTQAALDNLDLGELMEVLHRFDGSLHVEQEPGGPTVTVRLPRMAANEAR